MLRKGGSDGHPPRTGEEQEAGMSRKPRNILVAVLAVLVGSIGLAANDSGGSGGAAKSERAEEDASWLTRDLWQFVTTPGSTSAPLTAEQEMQHLHQEAFKAQQARRQAEAEWREYQSWLTRDHWQFPATPQPVVALGDEED